MYGTKARFALLLCFAFPVFLPSQAGGPPAEKTKSVFPDGTLQSIENAGVRAEGDALLVTRTDAREPITMVFADSQGVGVQREQDQWWILPIGAAGSPIDANSALWVLPLDPSTKDHSWQIELHGGNASATESDKALTVSLNADQVTVRKAEARPHSDPFGHRFSLDFAGGAELEEALAAFYWGTMLPSVVEKTMAAHFPYSSGYVLSTLSVKAYAGSYPAVDHEFQIKGRLAMGSAADLDIVRRMIELQFKLMSDDPEQLYRAPTSVQPDGSREYHVRRNSMDNHQNAAMFPLTGNIEVIEESWHYYETTKDAAWLKRNLKNLENAAGWTLASVDPYGRVWSDVYYEDQVIKDGRETQAQAFAAYTFGLLADMERRMGRAAMAAHYAAISKKLAAALIAPLPMGYWDEKNQRFVDWVDRLGRVHDHIHLVANTLPVTLGYATVAQTRAVQKLVEDNAGEFERFPSFMAADIAGYDKSEIGDGGPYDLCAAGRYWFWDAAFRQGQGQGGMLLDQLRTVAAEGAKNGYFMGERYDMDHVYYIDGKDAHGAEKYYEYPNVFAAVLIEKLLGLSADADAGVSVAPKIGEYGSVDFEIPEYALRYNYSKDGFVLKNLAEKPRRFKVNLSGLGAGRIHYRLQDRSKGVSAGSDFVLTLEPQEEAHWISEP